MSRVQATTGLAQSKSKVIQGLPGWGLRGLLAELLYSRAGLFMPTAMGGCALVPLPLQEVIKGGVSVMTHCLLNLQDQIEQRAGGQGLPLSGEL